MDPSKINPNTFYQVIMAIGLLLSMGVNVLILLGSRTAQKRQISFAEEYASKAEVTNLSSEIKAIDLKLDESLQSLRAEIKADRLTLNEAGEERSSKIHHRIDLILESVSELRGEMKARSYGA